MDFGLMLLDPEDLRRSESRQGIVAGNLDQIFATDARANLVAFIAATLIVPEDRGPEDLSFIVEQDESVHLAGQANRLDGFAGGTGERADDAVQSGVPPLARILFGPKRVGREKVKWSCGAAHDAPVAIDEQRFGAGG